MTGLDHVKVFPYKYILYQWYLSLILFKKDGIDEQIFDRTS